MNNEYIIKQLERNGLMLQQILKGLDEVTFKWRVAPDKWNLLDVICHLYDEEREDFRVRVASILENPLRPLPKIDPYNWPEQRGYQSKDFERMIDGFADERKKSIVWLRALENPIWENAFQHPKVGAVSAQLILDNWLAHDYLHIRQVVRIKYEYLKAHTSNPLDYAGEW